MSITTREVLANNSKGQLASLLTSSHAGSLDGEEALNSIQWLRLQSAGRTGEGWDDRFANMLAFAATKDGSPQTMAMAEAT